MTADDLSAPLGLAPRRRRHKIDLPVPKIIAGALALFLGAFVLWAVVADDPFGGEPIAVVPANLQLAAKPPGASGAPAPAPPPTALSDAAQHNDVAAAAPAGPSATAPAPAAPANTTTVTIIDGKTGAKQDVLVAAPANAAAPVNVAASADA